MLWRIQCHRVDPTGKGAPAGGHREVIGPGKPGDAVQQNGHVLPALDDASLDASVSRPRRDPVYPGVGHPVVDALHYDLDLAWDPEERLLTGRETLLLRAELAGAAALVGGSTSDIDDEFEGLGG